MPILATSSSVSLPATVEDGCTVDVTTSLAVLRPELWTPDRPFVYSLVIGLKGEDDGDYGQSKNQARCRFTPQTQQLEACAVEILQCEAARIGFRSVTVIPHKFNTNQSIDNRCNKSSLDLHGTIAFEPLSGYDSGSELPRARPGARSHNSPRSVGGRPCSHEEK